MYTVDALWTNFHVSSPCTGVCLAPFPWEGILSEVIAVNAHDWQPVLWCAPNPSHCLSWHPPSSLLRSVVNVIEIMQAKSSINLWLGGWKGSHYMEYFGKIWWRGACKTNAITHYGQDNLQKLEKAIKNIEEIWTHISTLKKLKLTIVDDVLGG